MKNLAHRISSSLRRTVPLLLLVLATSTTRAAGVPWNDSNADAFSSGYGWWGWTNAPRPFFEAQDSPSGAVAPAAAGENLTVDNGETYAVTADDTYANVYVGGDAVGTINHSAGTLTATANVVLGINSGGQGTYNLSGSGTLDAQGSVVVAQSGTGVFNQTGGTLTTPRLDLGEVSGTGTYNLSGTGRLSAAEQNVGFGSQGIFNQTGGTNSASSFLLIGGNTGGGSYSLSGGSLTAATEYVGYGTTGAFTQNGGSHSVTGKLYIGYLDGTTGTAGAGTYTLNSGTLTTAATYVGNLGAGTFTQTGGTHTVNGYLVVGFGAVGTYNFSGGTLTSTESVDIGNYVSVSYASTDYGNGTFNQTAGSINFSNALAVGADGSTGVYNLSGGTLASLQTAVGISSGSTDLAATGTFNQTAGTFAAGSGLFVGYAQPGVTDQVRGTFNLSNAAVLTADAEELGSAATGYFYQSGTSQNTTPLLYVGFANGNTQSPSSGSYTLSGGTLTTGQTQIGNAATGVFEQTGGSHLVTDGGAGQVFLGLNGGSGTYVLSNGSLVIPNQLYVGYSGSGGTTGTGLFVQHSGTVSTALVELGVNTGSAGTYDLEGGTLTTGSVSGGSGTSTFNFNGGTLQAAGNSTNFVGGLNTAEVRNSGALVDTNGYNVTVPQDVVHSTISMDNAIDGGLTKLGAGTLTLTGSNSYTGGTNFDAGTLNVGSAGALGTTGALSFGGGTLQYSAANQTDYSARFSAATNQAYSIDTNGQNVTYATGLMSSGGSLTKLGAGTLTLTGSNTYTGNTVVEAGTLALTAGALGVNDSTTNLIVYAPTNVASTFTLSGSATLKQNIEYIGPTESGTFTQSGGTNNVGNGLFLGFNGDSTTTGVGTYNLSGGTLNSAQTQLGNYGTGTFNQSGGTHIISLNSLYLGLNGGSGTYNLTGGTLSIAAAMNVGYSDSGSTHGIGTFNQEGGTADASAGVILGQNDSATGTYNLDGGTLTTSSVAGGSGTSTFNFNGGTLQASQNNGSVISGVGTLQIRNGFSTIDTQGYNVTINQGITHSNVSGDNATDGGISKNGTGTLTFNGYNTYTGNTRVYGGTLVVNGTLTSPASTVVNSSATLGGSGLIEGNVFILAGGTLAPSQAEGLPATQFVLNSNLSIATNAFLSINLSGAAPSTGYDDIIVGGAITLGGDLRVTLGNGFTPTLGESFIILDDSSTSLTTGVFANAPTGLYVDAAGDRFLVDYAADVDPGSAVPNDVTLTYLGGPLVPEPSTWALLGVGLFALGLARRRQRRPAVVG